MLDPLPGTIVNDRFLVKEQIGAGGFSAIYRATHLEWQQDVALKTLLPRHLNDRYAIESIRREAEVPSLLRNAHTLAAFEHGKTDDRIYIATELLRGETMSRRLTTERRIEWTRAVKILCELCESLAEAHLLGIVHRDLKPANIHLERQGNDRDFVKVFDFGIAKILRATEVNELTGARQAIGTLEYMSPEQLRGENVSERSDIYALGIILYEAIAGRRPFPAATTSTAAHKDRMASTPEPLSWRGLAPRELDKIVTRCLEPAAHRRYSMVEELHEDLASVLPAIAPVALGVPSSRIAS